MNIYHNYDEKIKSAIKQTLDENGENNSIFTLVSEYFTPGVASCLLTRDLFKKSCVYELYNKKGKIIYLNDNTIIYYNKGIVYYIEEYFNYYNVAKDQNIFETQVVEGLYRNSKNGDKEFIPKAYIEIKNAYNNNFDAKITQINDFREINYIDNGQEKKYSWNYFNKIIMHKRGNDYFCEYTGKFSPFTDNMVKNFSKKIVKKLEENK